MNSEEADETECCQYLPFLRKIILDKLSLLKSDC
jgi:hypothetical protein